MSDLPNKADFSTVRDWVFDLDNTLYPHHIDLFAQIDQNMTGYVSALLGLSREDARALQKQYYYDHGTTLNGLMIHHKIDPADFLEKAHAIDYNVLSQDLPRNLVVPKTLGMKTVLLVPQDTNHEFVDAWEKRTEKDQHIDYATSDLTGFLNALL